MTKLVCTSCGEVHRAPFQPERGDLTCTCGGHRVLPSQAKPRKPLSRVSEGGPSRSSLRRGKGFSASTEQQRKVKGLPCIVCGRDEYEGVRIEAAHVYPRRLQACDCAEGVVPLCSEDHGLYDDQNSTFDLQPYLVNRKYHAELVHAVAVHEAPLSELLRVVTGCSWEPVGELAA